jgi:hypothetical protein
MSKIDNKQEFAKCSMSVIYFLHTYVWIFNATVGAWIPFQLWPAQVGVLRDLLAHLLNAILKARQLGFTWLVLGYCLWRMLFRPISSIGLFSKGDREAQELLDRLKKMHDRLPEWMRQRVVVSNGHTFEFASGSIARALPTTGGESFTFSVIFCDEISRFDNAAELLIAVKPTIDAGGQMIIGSIIDKDRLSEAPAKMMKAAWRGENGWHFIFLPWNANPNRDQTWYDAVFADALARHGGDIAGAQDEVFTQYPKSPDECFSPRSQNKRIPYAHLRAAYQEMNPLQETYDAPALPFLSIFHLPQSGHEYVFGADPAEGVEGGDDSCCNVLDKTDGGRQVAVLRGKMEPKKVFPAAIFRLAQYYNEAVGHIERNGHGHAVLGELAELTAAAGKTKLCGVKVLSDPYDGKPGWLSSPRGKVALYDTGAQMIKDCEVIIHDEATYLQLQDIDIMTLLASSSGGHDDAADALCLSAAAILGRPKGFHSFNI